MKRTLLFTLAGLLATTMSYAATSSTRTTAGKSPTTTATTRTAARTHESRAVTDEPATSHSSMGLRAIGGAVGFVSPENVDGALTLGVFADCGRITPRIGLEPHLDYWSETQESFGTKATLSDVILGARGKYYFEVANPRIQPFAGAGLGIHMLHAKVTVTEPGFPDLVAEDSESKLGIDLGGGVMMPVGPRTDMLGEMWYGIVSDVSQFSMRLGLSYHIGS